MKNRKPHTIELQGLREWLLENEALYASDGNKRLYGDILSIQTSKQGNTVNVTANPFNDGDLIIRPLTSNSVNVVLKTI